MSYLEGEQIKMKAPIVRQYIGKRVQYLLNVDVDRSGRGYCFPRYGAIEQVQGKNIFLDSDTIYMTNVVEMVLVEKES